jgi:hypothetical protein
VPTAVAAHLWPIVGADAMHLNNLSKQVEQPATFGERLRIN